MGKQQETEHVAADLKRKGNRLNPENGGAGTKRYKVGKLESQDHVNRRSWGEQIAELTSAPLLVPGAGGEGAGAAYLPPFCLRPFPTFRAPHLKKISFFWLKPFTCTNLYLLLAWWQESFGFG